MRNHTHTTRSESGITLVEMMVALAITTLVVLVVNQLFNSVIATVARGTQGGEILQKSRTLDEQLAFESELELVSPYDKTAPAGVRAGLWRSRMVGPAGRYGNAPGSVLNPVPAGFLAVVQRRVQAPLTFEDLSKAPADRPFIRSDQLMFIYDQDSPLDAGNKRMPAMAPSSRFSFTGDERDSINAEYVRLWYGHVLQLREDQDATDINMAVSNNYRDIDLGEIASGNPNALAQDWVLGRHALFLTDISLDPDFPTVTRPYAPHLNVPPAFGIPAFGAVSNDVPNSPRLANGIIDVANLSLTQLTGAGSTLDNALNKLAYQGTIMSTMFTQTPLLTAAKPVGPGVSAGVSDMRAWDVAPTHTYFMGGVSDFIVEFAGDLVNETFYMISTPALQVGSDGELDRDPEGRIKWYTALNANFKVALNSPPAISQDIPITYPIPDTTDYDPHMDPALVAGFSRADAAFVWQHAGTPEFTQWPWMIRIRYRLHDRRGDFQGREVTDNSGATPQQVLEPGQWFETIIPVNYQDLP